MVDFKKALDDYRAREARAAGLQVEEPALMQLVTEERSYTTGDLNVSGVITRLVPVAEPAVENVSVDQAFVPEPPLTSPDDPPQFSAVLGTAGTGKTYQARLLADTRDDVLLCATTGIAAVNLNTRTLNSLLWYFDTADMQTKYELGQLNVALRQIADSGYRWLVIDELSMMDGRQLDILCMAVDGLNERRTYANEQQLGLMLVGDFAQLPPVNAPFAFQRPAWDRFKTNLTMLTEPRRQADPAFVRALQAVRKGLVDEAMAYFAPKLQQGDDRSFVGTSIMAKNDEVDRFNQMRMLDLKGGVVRFPSYRTGQESGEWKHIPSVLELKPGALVMILKNKTMRIDGTPPHQWPMIYANGDLGIFEGMETATVTGSDGELLIARPVAYVKLLRGGKSVPVEYLVRHKTKVTGATGAKKPRVEILGTIDYMPLRVAYGSTCHKSQGLSLDSVQVLLHSHFWTQPSMAYVAMSRARTPEGLRIVCTEKQLRARIVANKACREWL